MPGSTRIRRFRRPEPRAPSAPAPALVRRPSGSWLTAPHSGPTTAPTRLWRAPRVPPAPLVECVAVTMECRAERVRHAFEVAECPPDHEPEITARKPGKRRRGPVGVERAAPGCVEQPKPLGNGRRGDLDGAHTETILGVVLLGGKFRKCGNSNLALCLVH